MNRALFVLLLVLLSTKAIACICWFSTNKESVKEKIKEADLIIYATAMPDSLNQNFEVENDLPIENLVFKVEKVWKGQPLKTVKLNRRQYPCEDAHYKVGERFIIFAYLNKDTGLLETNICCSLSEETKPDPLDESKLTKEFDYKRHREFIHKKKQEFESVRGLIMKSKVTVR